MAGEGILHNRSSMISLAQRLWVIRMRARRRCEAQVKLLHNKKWLNPSAVEFRQLLARVVRATPYPIIKIDL